MRLARISRDGRTGLALWQKDGVRAVFDAVASDLDTLVVEGGLQAAAERAALGEAIDLGSVAFLPPFVRAPKIICLGLNYKDHAAEGGFKPPEFPTVFARFSSSLIGHGAPMKLPAVSTQLDFEGELVAVLGSGGRHISHADALSHVIGYSVFNDGSIRDYQMKTPQWTVGKNFDDTGAFGPWFVTADELPPGAAGLHIETRLNGEIVQSASTEDMIFDVATTISLLSTCMTLQPGDLLVMGTPSGVGAARKPPLFMKPGDVCEVEIEKIGLLRSPIVAA